MTPPAPEAKLRALVVEDEWPARNYLVEILQASGQAEVVAAVATLEEARQALGPGGIVVDVAFLDIRLATSGDEDAGLQLVRSLAGQPGAPLCVLTTALRQHAVEAYDLGVVDYLLKPFGEERVAQCLARLRARRAPPSPPPSPPRLVARSRKGLVFLGLDEVWALEASGRLTFVHAAHGRFDVDLSLSAIEACLAGRLLRVHRSWLVNVAHIRALEREEGDTEVRVGADLASALHVPVARDRIHAVREQLLAGATGIRR